MELPPAIREPALGFASKSCSRLQNTRLEPGQLMPREFSQGMQSSCLLPDSMHYQFTRDEACGFCL